MIDLPMAAPDDVQVAIALENQRLHALEVARLVEMMAIQMGIRPQDAKKYAHAAQTHDIGEESFAGLFPIGKTWLESEEWKLVHSHPELGAQILADRQHSIHTDLSLNIEAARFHHERWNGSGYPHGLFGTEIPEIARWVAVADVFAALANPARDCGMGRLDILSYLKSRAGILYDPRAVAVLATIIHSWPAIGTRSHSNPFISTTNLARGSLGRPFVYD